ADRLQNDEGDEEVEADGHGGGEDVQLQGDSTRADLNKLTAVNTPIPRGAMHLNKVRSPHYHRTQYLSNLGIWAKKEAKHLNSSRPTEARYKSNFTSATTTTPGEPSPVSPPPPPPPPPPETPSDEAPLAAATSRTGGSARPQPAAGEAAAVSEVVPSESPRPQPAPRDGDHDQPRRQGGDKTGSPPSEASGGDGGGGGVVPPQPASTGAGGRVGVVAAVVGASSLAGEALDGEEGGQDTAVVAAAAVAVAVTAPARSQPSVGAATAAPPASAARTADSRTPVLGATNSSAEDSSTNAAAPASTHRRNEKISPSSAAAPVPAASTPAAAIIPPLLGAPAAAAQPTSSSSSSHRLRSARTVADPLKVGSPPLRAVRPPRRDIRRDYLTNLGMKRAVVAGPGDARTPPPMIRRSSFIESVENPVEEQLKDPNAGEITLEGVLRVFGSILTGGNITKKEREPRPCRTCERLRAGNSGGSSADSSPTVGWHGGAQDCRGGEGRRGVQGSGGGGEGEGSVAESAPCRHKHVDFAPVVSAVYVPVHSEYSDRVRRSYWNSAGEIREMVYRNMIEFDAEEYNWENVAEEEDMYFCEETGEFIHPIFFDCQDEAREVRATSSSATSSSDRDGEEHVEYINEGRGLPVMQQR
ncbi:unnamed protein product, partial [Ectocarpus sp. 13 AM-2016]